MNALNLETTVGQLVAEQPARSRIFEDLGIDYCCGGRRPLGKACEAKGLDPAAVLIKLEMAGANAPMSGRDWTMASLTELADHIEQTHHAYVRVSLPRLSDLIDKVNRAHGADDDRLGDLRVVFARFRAHFESHMSKEELILFPLCREIDRSETPSRNHCGSVQNPIKVMITEHDDAGDDLAKMRALTDDFTPLASACNTYRAMMQALVEFEADTHQHVHIENNILFVKAVEAANSSAATDVSGKRGE